MFKICIVGCGFMSEWVHGPSFLKYAKENTDTVLSGCCDLDLVKAENYRIKFGFCNAYDDLDLMLDTEKPHAVALISPVTVTKDLSIRILKKGFPLIMEKPPGLTPKECLEIINATNLYKIPARVAFNRRYQPLLKELKERLNPSKDRIYNIYYSMIRNERYDDDFSTTSIHAIDTVKYLANSDYKYLNIKYQYLPEIKDHIANIYMEGETESGIIVRLEFLVAAGAEIERCIVNGYETTYLLNTPLGTDAPGKLTQIHKKDVIEDIEGENDFDYYITGGFFNENAEFFDLVRLGNLKEVNDVESGLQSVEIAYCIRNRITEYIKKYS